MNYKEACKIYSNHLNPAFVRLLEIFGYGRLITRAENCWIWDDKGNKYLDLVAGFGSHPLGHHCAVLQEQIKKSLDAKPYTFLHTGPSESQARLAELLAKKTGFDFSLLASGGAEAIQIALGLAICVTGRSAFVCVEDAFHGTSLGVLHLMGSNRYRKPFERIFPSTTRIPFGDTAALEKALRTKRAAAFVLEPILAEGGVIFPPEGYLDEASLLCKKYGTLLVIDEIQTGIGRTGRFLFSETMKERPDAVCIGKGLSGGLLPISAVLTSRQHFEKAFGSIAHFDFANSTYGGNALSCDVAWATISELDRQDVCAKSGKTALWFLEELKKRLAHHALVKEIRGCGWMIGVEIGASGNSLLSRLLAPAIDLASELSFGQWFSLALLEEGVMVQPCANRWDVLKIIPPLTISREECEVALSAFSRVFERYSSTASVAAAVTKRLTERHILHRHKLDRSGDGVSAE